MLTRLSICSLSILTICNISYCPFGFEGCIWVLIALVPDLCILFTFNKYSYKYKSYLLLNNVYIKNS